ncbi:hypothetical protein GOP47_0027081 [Adiantum capillus-veneris]|nr:hypothetical protein GOP47_0027081 [Adiantum capillus-veneris]
MNLPASQVSQALKTSQPVYPLFLAPGGPSGLGFALVTVALPISCPELASLRLLFSARVLLVFPLCSVFLLSSKTHTRNQGMSTREDTNTRWMRQAERRWMRQAERGALDRVVRLLSK